MHVHVINTCMYIMLVLCRYDTCTFESMTEAKKTQTAVSKLATAYSYSMIDVIQCTYMYTHMIHCTHT